MPRRINHMTRPLVGALIAVLLPIGAHAGTALEEITVSFEVPRLTTKDIFVHYDGSTVYLPFTEVFHLLDLNVATDPDRTRIEGFFVTKSHRYEMRPKESRAVVNGVEFPLVPGEFQYDGMELYLRVDLFKRLFGLDMTFDFSMLRVLLPLNEDFPAYQRLKRKRARDKLQQSVAGLKNVKIMPRKHEWFSGGVVDWTLSANPLGGGQYADLGFGSMFLGGDLSVASTGNTVTGFQMDQVTYKWHYAFNPNPYVAQAEVGSINSGGFLSRSLDGLLVTNRPQIQRTYFQTINLSGKLEPGWEVELYADGRLLDFAEADEAGDYHFNVDIQYGSSDLQLKMYGPNGEIRTEERHLRVPYTLIPRKQVEYTLAGGRDAVAAVNRWYTQANAYYGITSRLTVGSGFDLPLSTDSTSGMKSREKPLAAGEATYLVTGSMIANASFAPSYQALVGLNYTMPSSVSANLSFTKYYENRMRNPIEQQYNAAISLSAPIHIGQRYLGLRYYFARDQYRTFGTTSMNYGFSASAWRLYLNYVGRYKVAQYPTRTQKTMTSQVLLSTDHIRWLRPQFRVDYDHIENAVSRFGVYVTRRLFKTGQINLSYERSPLNKSSMFMLNVNFFIKQASFSSRAQYADGKVSMSQIQRGSIRYDRSAGALRFDRRNGIGYGSAVVRPFIDTDNNGIPGKNEEVLPGLKARISGIGGRPIGRGRMFYYDGLRPYDTYMLQVDATTLDNPLLKPTYDNFKVSVNPNVVTVINVPVVMAADVSGVVEHQSAAGLTGLGGISLHLVNISKDVVTDIVTFSNGQFYYLGLIPGNYRAYLDSEQLERFGYASEPKSIEFEVKPSTTGSSIENINFVLVPKQ